MFYIEPFLPRAYLCEVEILLEYLALHIQSGLMLALCRLSTTKSFTFTVSLLSSLYHSIRCRDRAWSAGAGLYLSVPAGEAVLWLPRRNPDENAKAGHPAAHRLQHDNR